MKGESQHKAWKTLFAVSLAVFVVNVDYWAATVALPDMAKQFNVHAVTLEWVLTVYIISFCTTVSVAGRLGDIFGRKKLLLLGVALFGIFSVWVGLSNSFWMIIAARIALGIGGGLIFPLSTAVLGYATKPSEMSKMIGLRIGLGAVGAAVGPVIGGILTETMGWPWIFFMNLPRPLHSDRVSPHQDEVPAALGPGAQRLATSGAGGPELLCPLLENVFPNGPVG